MPPPPTTRAFFGYLSFFYTKSSGKQIRAKTIWLKKCVNKPNLDLKQKVFPRNKLKIPNSPGEKMDDYGRIIEFLPNRCRIRARQKAHNLLLSL